MWVISLCRSCTVHVTPKSRVAIATIAYNVGMSALYAGSSYPSNRVDVSGHSHQRVSPRCCIASWIMQVQQILESCPLLAGHKYLFDVIKFDSNILIDLDTPIPTRLDNNKDLQLHTDTEVRFCS